MLVRFLAPRSCARRELGQRRRQRGAAPASHGVAKVRQRGSDEDIEVARGSERLGKPSELDAQRLEIAHVQYYGWALANRAALLPTRGQVDEATRTVEAARARLKGRLVIDYVVPDYYATYPKSCMGGWGRQTLNVTPSGKVLPCHAAETITTLAFDRVTERSLEQIWTDGAAFCAFRGTDWMPEPCRSCARKEIDWGGCRCQALAFAGRADATDPACSLSPLHGQLVALADQEASRAPPAFVYRRPGNSATVRAGAPLASAQSG